MLFFFFFSHNKTPFLSVLSLLGIQMCCHADGPINFQSFVASCLPHQQQQQNSILRHSKNNTI